MISCAKRDWKICHRHFDRIRVPPVATEHKNICRRDNMTTFASALLELAQADLVPNLTQDEELHIDATLTDHLDAQMQILATSGEDAGVLSIAVLKHPGVVPAAACETCVVSTL